MLNGFSYLSNHFWMLIVMNKKDTFSNLVEATFDGEEKPGGNKIIAEEKD